MYRFLKFASLAELVGGVISIEFVSQKWVKKILKLAIESAKARRRLDDPCFPLTESHPL